MVLKGWVSNDVSLGLYSLASIRGQFIGYGFPPSLECHLPFGKNVGTECGEATAADPYRNLVNTGPCGTPISSDFNLGTEPVVKAYCLGER